MCKVVFADLPEKVVWCLTKDMETMVVNAIHAHIFTDRYPGEYGRYLASKGLQGVSA